jgi:hypothetical protein
MEYWKPKSGGLGNVASSDAALVPSSKGQYQEPKAELPEVGAKILLVIHPYGGASLVDGEKMIGGLDVVEVEVTAIKKSKTTIE